jgi:cell division protein FtsX
MAVNGTRLGLVAAVTGLLLAGCGGSGNGSSGATTTESTANARVVKAGLKPPAGCYLTVFLSDDATAGQRNGVQRLMVTSKRVASVSYVSKELAMKRFAKRKPEIARRMHTNLFPNSFEVVPRSRLDVYPIILDFAAGVPGVENVRASTPCGRA